jgi:hypothetical protein
VSRGLFARALVIAIGLLVATPVALVAAQEVPPEATVCHDGSLPRQTTEVSADIAVAGFDPSLGTLLEVLVPTQSVHLDTDAVFENIAQTAIPFAAQMNYEITFTSPGGLASPGPVAGTVERVPMQAIPAFDGVLDFAGASAVAQPSIARDAAAGAVSSTDAGVLAAFTGGSVAFHVASSIGETFTGGGGNIHASINTYASASVRVCYRYAPSPPPPPPPTTPPGPPVAPPPAAQVAGATATRELAFRGAADGRLATGGTVAAALGAVLVLRARRRDAIRHLDVGGVDAGTVDA